MQQRKEIKRLREKLKRYRKQFQKALIAGKKNAAAAASAAAKGKSKDTKEADKSKKFRTVLFGGWAKRSHRRLYRLLEKPGVAVSTKRKVVRTFHKYYHRAMRQASKWQGSSAKLSTYLNTVTKIWTRKSRWLIEKAKTKKKPAAPTPPPAAKKPKKAKKPK